MVVWSGETVVEPFTGTPPTPLSIKALWALVDVHVKTEDCPGVMLAGLELKFIKGGDVLLTVIVILSVAVPPKPVAVIV